MATLANRAFGRGPERPLIRFAQRTGFGSATAVYTMTTADYPLVKAARNRHLFIVHEQFMSPDYWRIVRDERDRFYGVEDPLQSGFIEKFEEDHIRQWRAADRILVPSSYVGRACIALGASPNQVRSVPYGLPESWASSRPNPKPFRIICVGAVSLAKGSHYFAMATKKLRKRGIPVEAIAIGSGKEKVEHADLFRGPSYVGIVPREEMKAIYQSADVLVHPTLSDSFGLVQLEAMAFGVPVITTPNSADLVRDGVEGLIVPCRAVDQLADAIERMVTDRSYRAHLSENAVRRAADFSWRQYADALLTALN